MLIKSSGQTSLKQYGRSLNTAVAQHVAQGARSPWIAHPSSTMTIWGASGDSAYVCVAVVGRN